MNLKRTEVTLETGDSGSHCQLVLVWKMVNEGEAGIALESHSDESDRMSG